MATHTSAVKRHAQSLRRRTDNMAVKSGVKSAIKKVRDAVKEGKAEESKTYLADAVKLLDKAVTKGVFHRNNASRRISRLTTAVNAVAAK